MNWQEQQRAILNALEAQDAPTPRPQTFYVVAGVKTTTFDMFGNPIRAGRIIVTVESCLFRHRAAAERLAAQTGGAVYAVELDGYTCPEDAP